MQKAVVATKVGTRKKGCNSVSAAVAKKDIPPRAPKKTGRITPQLIGLEVVHIW